MAKTMTPSAGSSKKKTTAGQIDKAVANYRALLEKHSGEFDTEAVQTVLGQSELAGEQLAVFRHRVEAVSNLIVRRVKVNRSRTPQVVLEATGRKLYVNDNVVATMPHGEGEETDVYFFKVSRYLSDAALEKEYELWGLKPADPYSQAAVNEDDSSFADDHPNGTHWQDADGQWCYAAFRRWLGGRSVVVRRLDDVWSDGWWFAGLRKLELRA